MSDKKFLPEQVTAALVKEMRKDDPDEDDYVDSSVFDWTEESLWNGRELSTEVGVVREVQKSGGEGQGDRQHLVIETIATGQFFRVDGWYNSYDGGEYDGELYEVQRVVKSVVFYE